MSRNNKGNNVQDSSNGGLLGKLIIGAVGVGIGFIMHSIFSDQKSKPEQPAINQFEKPTLKTNDSIDRM